MGAGDTLFKSNHDRVPQGIAPYGLGEWDRRRGNHRAVVRVEGEAEAVCAYLPWRRRDAHPEGKQVMVIDAQTDAVVANTVVATCNREYGEIVFQPVSGPGEYHLYYMVPMEDAYGETWPRSSFPIIQYKRPQNRSDPAWLARQGLTAEALESNPDPRDWHRPGAEPFPAVWRELPVAALVEFQARGERHSFYPMEVVATVDECWALEHRHRFQPFILFPERRERPIRMTDRLPYTWAVRDDEGMRRLTDTAMRNEYYVFQIGVYASKQLLHDVKASWTGLEAETGAAIPPEALTCFNLGGVDQHGQEFAKRVHVETGRIQALWFGVDIAIDAEPGCYRGTVSVAADDQGPQTIELVLTVEDGVLADRGDGDHWRQSRLRWLNSRIGLDEEVCAPFSPIAVDGDAVEILGRRIELADSGLVEQVTSFIEMFEIREEGRAVLSGSARFEVVCGGALISWGEQEMNCVRERPGVARFASTATSAALKLRVETVVEMDGFIEHRMRLEADEPVAVDGIRLTLPFAGEVVRYVMWSATGGSGGNDFSEVPEEMWECPAEGFELLWLGDYNAGLCLRLPPEGSGWVNQGKGRVCRETVDGGQRLVVDAGPQRIEGCVEFRCELYATPFKPLTREHWGWRHFHESYGHSSTVAEGQEAGATIFTYHHARRTNPHISYPFLVVDEMKEVADEIHAGGGRFKIYYTIRELSDRAAELWALRSLGAEILPGSPIRPGYSDTSLGYEPLAELPLEYQLRNQVSWPYTGQPWMCEHLVADYHARWHSTVDMGGRTIIDSSLQISGASRWSNFYMEGLNWLMEHAGVDGIYLDGITFDRESFKRVRKTLVRGKPEGLIDYHSHPTTIAQMPYFDRLWNGEGADYRRGPDYWLVAISGVPFGVPGELLQASASVQRGMVFGVSQRYGWMPRERVDPRGLWRWWDAFDIAGARMLGYWQEACPVATGHDGVKATAYVHRGERVAIAVASWAEEEVVVGIELDWEAVGLDPEDATVSVPAIDFFQEELAGVSLEAIPVAPDGGWIIVVSRV